MKDELKKRLRSFGLSESTILLPKKSTDYYRWATVACDQYTSQREYWQSVEELTNGYPTTFRLIFPECYLEDSGKEKRIVEINRNMQKYLDEELFDSFPDSFILVERTTESGTRLGLMASLDLECYSYAKDSKTLVRATEGTILSRIPPRKEIRKNAPLELPHIMVLISDSERSIIEKLESRKDKMQLVYDTDLMKDGGHVKGYLVSSDEDTAIIADGFERLFKALSKENPLLFAMGDGNHSLATAKSCWEDIKKTLSKEEMETHPARFALVELENIFDEALKFEPIHRVFFKTNEDDFFSLVGAECESVEREKVKSLEELEKKINEKSDKQRFGIVTSEGFFVISLSKPSSSIAAGTIQRVIDNMLEKKIGEVDYIHGANVTSKLGSENGNIGLILPDVSKESFFDSIIKEGAFPRKTFSIGHANEKRYYMEARKIK